MTLYRMPHHVHMHRVCVLMLRVHSALYLYVSFGTLTWKCLYMYHADHSSLYTAEQFRPSRSIRRHAANGLDR